MTCVLDELDASTRALKRAQYEAFDFRLTNGGVRVRNGSHANPGDHVYDVTVTGGVPTACTCPADEHHETACKHRLAVAIREPVLDAAVANAADDDDQDDRNDRDDDSSGTPPIPVTDGAGIPGQTGDDDAAPDVERPDDCDCPDDSGSFPCWPCVRDGDREIPAVEALLGTTNA